MDDNRITDLCRALHDEINNDSDIAHQLVTEVEELVRANKQTRKILFARLSSLLGVNGRDNAPRSDTEPSIQEILHSATRAMREPPHEHPEDHYHQDEQLYPSGSGQR